MTFDLVQVIIAVVGAAVGFLARGRVPAPVPDPAPSPQPNQFPLLELILKLLAERFRVPLPGQPLPQETLHAPAEPPWVQQLLAEVRGLKRG